jgi:hypothetical protein
MDETTNTPEQALQNETFSSQPADLAAPDAPLHDAPQVEQIIIGEDITEDDRNRIYKRLGRPDTHEAYDLNGIVPETYNQGIVEDFKKKAHENGMTNEAARKMAEWYKEIELKQQEAYRVSREAQADQNILELKKEFGVRFDDEVKNARKALDAYTDKAFKQYMDDTGLGNHPALVKAFAKIGRELSEDRLVQSETASRLAQNEDLRRSEIVRLRADKTFMERYRRGDPMAVQRLNKLYLDD